MITLSDKNSFIYKELLFFPSLFVITVLSQTRVHKMYSKRLLLFFIVQLVIEYSFVFAQTDKSENDDDLLKSLHETITNTCRENKFEDKLDLIENAFNEFTSCSENTLNLHLVIQDMFDSSLKGTVAEMANRQCAKSSEAKSCIKKLMDAVSLCENAEERQELNLITTMYFRALDFTCYNNGERLNDFIVNGGLNCIGNKSTELSQCFDSLTLNTAEVSEFDEWANCMVNHIAACETKSGTIIRSMYTYMRQGASDPEAPVTTATAAL